MTPILSYTLISGAAVAGAGIAYLLYRLGKRKPATEPEAPGKILMSPVSYEKILDEAVNKNQAELTAGKYDLCILPPEKALEYLRENNASDMPKDFGRKVAAFNRCEAPDKLAVIWFLMQGDNVVRQDLIVSNALAPDFTDIVPADKIYVKHIILS